MLECASFHMSHWSEYLEKPDGAITSIFRGLPANSASMLLTWELVYMHLFTGNGMPLPIIQIVHITLLSSQTKLTTSAMRYVNHCNFMEQIHFSQPMKYRPWDSE